MKKWSLSVVVLLCVVSEMAGQTGTSALSKKFESYQTVWTRTKIHLVFSQDKYAPGDTAFFKAYFLKDDLTGVAGKQLINLNLVDSHGISRISFLFNVNNGIGQNQLAIPDTLPAGLYLVTAYSSSMKNFDPIPLFKKEIAIVRKNTIRRTETPVTRVAVEGGHLLRRVANKIGIVSKPGSEVQIVEATGPEIQRVTTDANGLASVTITPLDNASNAARIFARLVGDTSRIFLPALENDGRTIQLTTSSSGEPLKILITSPPDSSLPDEDLYIIVSARGKIYHATIFQKRSKEDAVVLIPQKELPEGVVHISLLHPGGALLASRDFYSEGQRPVNVKIESPTQDFHIRDKVRLEVLLTDREGKPAEGEFSVSVVNSGLFEERQVNTLVDELTILAGRKENVRIDHSTAVGLTSLDNFLIATTEPEPWANALSNSTGRPRFGFTSVIQKNGIATLSDTHEPVPDFTQILFYLQKDKMHYQTFSTNQGKVGLTIHDFFGQDEFFYVAEKRNGREIPNLKIEWEDAPIKLPRSPASIESERPDAYAAFVAKTRAIQRSYGFFASGQKLTTDSTDIRNNEFEDEIMGADVTVNVADFVLFPTMDDLVKEVVPSLYHRNLGQKSMVRVNLEALTPRDVPPVPTGDPVYIIDGIATRNTSFFLSLKPVDLLTIKIVKTPQKLARFNLMGKNGIVIVHTKKGNAREPLDDPSKVIEGLNRSVTFKGPYHSSSQDSRRPDFRSTIYWNPSIKTDSAGRAFIEFYCSDDSGKLTIRVEGLASGGRPFSKDSEIIKLSTTPK